MKTERLGCLQLTDHKVSLGTLGHVILSTEQIIHQRGYEELFMKYVIIVFAPETCKGLILDNIVTFWPIKEGLQNLTLNKNKKMWRSIMQFPLKGHSVVLEKKFKLQNLNIS